MLLYLAKIAQSGRMYYRHPSGMGSVMMYYDDPELKYLKRVLVLDAKCRSNQRFGCYKIDSGNINIPHHDLHLNQSLNRFSDKYLINDRFPRDSRSSKENCDSWIKLNSVKDKWFDEFGYIGVPAVSYCRSILVDGVPCDLPNIQILTRIYIDRLIIDELDPTIAEHDMYALSARYNPQGNWKIGSETSSFVWSSSEYDSEICFHINSSGHINGTTKVSIGSVIPVLEI